MTKSKIGSYWGQYKFAILMLLLLVIFGYVVYATASIYTNNQRNQLQLTDIIVSGLFSLVLIIVYLEVANALKGQEKLLEIEIMPSIEIIRHYIIGDTIVLHLSNFGGLAKSLSVRTIIKLPSGEQFRHTTELYRLDSSHDPRDHDEQELLDNLLNERSITEGGQNLVFANQPGFVYGQNKRFINFRTGIFNAVNEGRIDQFEFQLELVYENRLNEESTKEIEIWSRWINVEEYADIPIKNLASSPVLEDLIIQFQRAV